MTNYLKMVPFIKKWEGGISKDTRDQCSKDPLPDGSGYHTNKGICWMTFKAVFGSGPDAVKKFYTMSDEDWGLVYKGLFWDAMKADQIKSQKVADIIVHWAWGSGASIPTKTIQKIVGVTVDGKIGPKTLEAINGMDEEVLVAKLKERNYAFFEGLVVQPKYSMYRKGWFNRLNEFYDKYLSSK
jgi:lysozyme family protein